MASVDQDREGDVDEAEPVIYGPMPMAWLMVWVVRVSWAGLAAVWGWLFGITAWNYVQMPAEGLPDPLGLGDLLGIAFLFGLALLLNMRIVHLAGITRTRIEMVTLFGTWRAPAEQVRWVRGWAPPFLGYSWEGMVFARMPGSAFRLPYLVVTAPTMLQFDGIGRDEFYEFVDALCAAVPDARVIGRRPGDDRGATA